MHACAIKHPTNPEYHHGTCLLFCRFHAQRFYAVNCLATKEANATAIKADMSLNMMLIEMPVAKAEDFYQHVQVESPTITGSQKPVPCSVSKHNLRRALHRTSTWHTGSCPLFCNSCAAQAMLQLWLSTSLAVLCTSDLPPPTCFMSCSSPPAHGIAIHTRTCTASMVLHADRLVGRQHSPDRLPLPSLSREHGPLGRGAAASVQHSGGRHLEGACPGHFTSHRPATAQQPAPGTAAGLVAASHAAALPASCICYCRPCHTHFASKTHGACEVTLGSTSACQQYALSLKSISRSFLCVTCATAVKSVRALPLKCTFRSRVKGTA